MMLSFISLTVANRLVKRILVDNAPRTSSSRLYPQPVGWRRLEQNVETLSQFQSENRVLRDQNQARNTSGNKTHRFNTQV
uniref:Uncharacterized protein n=1 Tax=Brassica oleracea TaxID=3712 RepID=A0A3P6GNT4_BRAOL|nr:unnamed protein product [Brassica oleracea]